MRYLRFVFIMPITNYNKTLVSVYLNMSCSIVKIKFHNIIINYIQNIFISSHISVVYLMFQYIQSIQLRRIKLNVKNMLTDWIRHYRKQIAQILEIYYFRAFHNIIKFTQKKYIKTEFLNDNKNLLQLVLSTRTFTFYYKFVPSHYIRSVFLF